MDKKPNEQDKSDVKKFTKKEVESIKKSREKINNEPVKK